jgi:predicted kinase
MEELRKELKKENELKAYQLFSRKIEQVCFSQLRRNSFVIFNASNSINEKMNDLIKCRIRSQKPYTQVIKIIAEFAETLIESAQGTI